MRRLTSLWSIRKSYKIREYSDETMISVPTSQSVYSIMTVKAKKLRPNFYSHPLNVAPVIFHRARFTHFEFHGP